MASLLATQSVVLRQDTWALVNFNQITEFLWMDIPKQAIFGFKPPKIASVSARRLQCDDPRVQKKWINLYKQKLLDMQVIQKQFKLESSVSSTLTQPQQQELEKRTLSAETYSSEC